MNYRYDAFMPPVQDDGLSMGDMELILDSFKGQSLDFFGAMRSATYDNQIRDWIKEIVKDDINAEGANLQELSRRLINRRATVQLTYTSLHRSASPLCSARQFSALTICATLLEHTSRAQVCTASPRHQCQQLLQRGQAIVHVVVETCQHVHPWPASMCIHGQFKAPYSMQGRLHHSLTQEGHL